MSRFAQTNLQLYRQMISGDCQTSELKAVAATYEYATTLFAARYRPSGKTFIAHLVGTASILAELSSPLPLVMAGLLHAAYECGDFGDGSCGLTRARRAAVRNHIGEVAEEFVACYASTPWDPYHLQLLASKQDVDDVQRAAVLLRVANEVEDTLDDGLLVCGEPRAQLHRSSVPSLLHLAEGLGFQRAAALLREAVAVSPRASLLQQLRPSQQADQSYVVVPASYRVLREALEARLSNTETERETAH